MRLSDTHASHPAFAPRRRSRPPRCRPPAALFDKLFGKPAPVAEAAPPSSSDEAALPLLPDEAALPLLHLLQGTVLAGQPLVLAYDAQRDGWTAKAFHARTDNRGPALVVATSAGGARFGGFNPVGFASREDYRDSNSAFLFRWTPGEPEEAEAERLRKVGSPAIFDFGAQGPCFGADALKIPLGVAPSMGSSYAGVGGSLDLGPAHAAGSTAARSRLGSHFSKREDGGRTLFADAEGMDAQLTSLRVFVSPGREGMYM